MFNRFSIFTQSLLTFEGERPYEHTLTLLYQHWFVLVGRMAGFLIALVVPLVLITLAHPYLERFGLISFIYALLWVYLLLVWYRFFFMLTMYLLDVWVVTDHRIVDSEQHGYFSRTVAEMDLMRVQDVSVKVNGFIQTLLDFGDVQIQTAGTQEMFVFKQVSHPNQIKDLIMQAHRNYMAAHSDGGEAHDHTV